MRLMNGGWDVGREMGCGKGAYGSNMYVHQYVFRECCISIFIPIPSALWVAVCWVRRGEVLW